MPLDLHPLYGSFEHKLSLCETITVDSRLSFLDSAKSILESSIYPVYSAVIDAVGCFLSSDHAPVHSVLDLPGGTQYYQKALRYQASSLDGELLHQFGLEQVDAVNQRLARSAANFVSTETTESYLLRRFGQSRDLFDFTQALLSYLEELNERACALADDCVEGVYLEALSFKAIPSALEASAPFAKYTPRRETYPRRSFG